MIHDRPYMQSSGAHGRDPIWIVWWILGITIGVFILQNLAIVSFPGPHQQGPVWINQWFAFSYQGIFQGKLWTVFSYALLHDPRSFFHIGFNMLMFFFLARVLVDTLGPRRLLVLYLVGALFGAGVFFVANIGGSIPLIGASASVFALLGFFCRTRMDEPQTFLIFFVLPVTLKPRYILWIAGGLSLAAMVLFELPGRSSVAHSAHLGGLVAGLFYFRFLNAVRPRYASGLGSQSRSAVQKPAWLKKRSVSHKRPEYRVNLTNREELQEELDRILDKINESGFGSLNEKERETLDRAKDLLSH